MDGQVFTCNSCMIQFSSGDLQRYHMKTEWHRYNLKRRIANLTPISAGLFAEKLQASEREKELNQTDEFGFPILKKSSNAKRKDKGRKVGRGRSVSKLNANDAEMMRTISPAPSVASYLSRSTFTSCNLDEETVTEFGFTSEDSSSQYSGSDSDFDSGFYDKGCDESDRISPTQCIYCGKQYTELESNVRHMFKTHGLFIPERSYLIDLKGLLNYIIEELLVKKNCMSCSFRGSSVESIRAHMFSKRHCMLPYESKEDRLKVASFYDFSSLSQRRDGKVHPSTANVHFNAENLTIHEYPEIFVEGRCEEEGNDPDNAINSNFALVHVDKSGVELTLPTGAKIGHRSMRKFYRQNLPLGSELSEDKKTLLTAERNVTSLLPSKKSQKATAQLRQTEILKKNKNIRLQLKRTNYQTHYRDELLQ